MNPDKALDAVRGFDPQAFFATLGVPGTITWIVMIIIAIIIVRFVFSVARKVFAIAVTVLFIAFFLGTFTAGSLGWLDPAITAVQGWFNDTFFKRGHLK